MYMIKHGKSAAVIAALVRHQMSIHRANLSSSSSRLTAAAADRQTSLEAPRVGCELSNASFDARDAGLNGYTNLSVLDFICTNGFII